MKQCVQAYCSTTEPRLAVAFLIALQHKADTAVEALVDRQPTCCV